MKHYFISPLSLSAATIIALTTILLTLLFILKRSPPTSLRCAAPPSPRRVPIIGNIHLLGSLPHRSLRDLSAKYGPVMLLHLGRVPTIVVSSAEFAREVMKTHDVIFAGRPHSSLAKRLMYDSDIAFAPYGEYWRQVRRICVVHLLSIRMVQSFHAVREEELALLNERIHESCRTTGSAINLSTAIADLTNNIICRVSFGRKYGDGYKFRELMLEFGALLGTFPARDYFVKGLGWLDWVSGLDARVRRNFSELDRFLDTVLEHHRRRDHAKAASNFLDVLLSLREDDMAGISLSIDNIKAIVLDMFAAGTDTIATAIEWVMAELIKNPDVFKRVQEEVCGVLRGKVNIKEEDIDKMHYMKATIKEALRLHPPVPLLVPRETTKDVELQGYQILAGTRVVVNAWAIGRDPKSWDRAEEFLPDRFMNSKIDVKGQDFELIPFGAGRRGCPGLGFGMATVEHTLAYFLQCFNWELPGGLKGEELDMSESGGITTHKKLNLILVAKPHNP